MLNTSSHWKRVPINENSRNKKGEVDMDQQPSQNKKSADKKKMLAMGFLGGPLLLGALLLEEKLAGSEPKQRSSAWKVGTASAVAGAGTALLAIPAVGAAIGMRAGTIIGDVLIPGRGKVDLAAQWTVGAVLGGAGAVAGAGLIAAAAIPLGIAGAAVGVVTGLAMKIKGGDWAEKAKATPPLSLSVQTLGMSLGKVAEKIAGRRTSAMVRSTLGLQDKKNAEPQASQKNLGL